MTDQQLGQFAERMGKYVREQYIPSRHDLKVVQQNARWHVLEEMIREAQHELEAVLKAAFGTDTLARATLRTAELSILLAERR